MIVNEIRSAAGIAPLATWEHVHHKDGNGRNNHPDNLMVLSASEHYALDVAYRSCCSRLWTRLRDAYGRGLDAGEKAGWCMIVRGCARVATGDVPAFSLDYALASVPDDYPRDRERPIADVLRALVSGWQYEDTNRGNANDPWSMHRFTDREEAA
jgi:hypothetical protein